MGTTGSSSGSEPRRIPAGCVARGRVRLPGSKSASHRHLNLALLARRPVVLEGLLEAEDLALFLDVLQNLGWRVETGGAETSLSPPRRLPEAATLQAGNAGTLCRFLTASLTTLPGRWTLDGSPRLRERPIGPLVEALSRLGAEIDYDGRAGFPPIEIRGGSLRGGETVLDAGSSSQYLSAVTMAALVAAGPVTIRVKALTSAPYVALTVQAIGRWGGAVDVGESLVRVRPGLEAPDRIRIPADDSSAAYPAAAAALTGGRVDLVGLDPGSVHGDRRFLEILERMGARVTWQPDETVRIEGPQDSLSAVDEDFSDMPDQVPTLAALAPFARGTTRIRNVAHLRIKESDRLAAMSRELGRLGAAVEEGEDSLTVHGTWVDAPPPTEAVVVSSWDDHRIAMSLALVGLRRPGTRIGDPEVVAKSYPGFWDDFEGILE